MIEAYRVGTALVLETGMAAQLSSLIQQWEALDRIIKQTRASLREFGALGDAARKMGRASTDMARAMPDVARQAEATAAAMERAASASQALTVWSPGYTTIGVPYTPYGYVPAGRPTVLPGPASGGALVPYNPGFTLGPGGPAMPYTPGGAGLPALGPQQSYGGAGGQQTQFGPFPLATQGYQPGGPHTLNLGYGLRPSHYDYMMAAAGYGIVGRGLTGFAGDVIHAGSEYGHQMTMLRAMGWTDEQLAGASRTAMQSQRDILGVTPSAALEAQRDIFTITRDVQESMRLAPDLLRSSVVLSEVGKGSQLQQLFQALQAGELRGVISPQQIPNFLRLIESSAVTTGGRVGPADILQFLRSSGVAGRILAEPDLFGQFIPEILSMGSARAGTGLQAFFQQFGIGRMSDAAVKNFLEQMGLAQEGAQFVKAGIGQWMALPGGLKGEELIYQGNEAQFMREVLLPAIDEYNRNHFGSTSPLMEARTGAALSSRIPGGRFLAEYFTLLPLSERYGQAIREGTTRDAYGTFAANDPTLKAMGLQSAWTGFLTSLSQGPVMDAAMKVLRDLTSALNGMGKFAQEHPRLASVLVEIAAALGTLAVAAAGFSAAMFLGGPMMRVAGFGAARVSGALTQASITRPGLITAGRLGLLGAGTAIVSEGLGGPDWITNAGIGASIGAAVAGPPGAATGALGGAAWGFDPFGLNDVGWNPLHPFSLSHRNLQTGQLEYDWERAGNQASAVPPAQMGPVQMIGSVNLDGRKVGDFTATSIARAGELPSAAPTGGDIRISIPQPGYSGAFP